MAKYLFKLYLKSGETKLILPETISGNNLYEFDRYTLELKGSTELSKILGEKIKVDSNDIETVVILNQKNAIEYSVIYVNEYLKLIVNDLKEKTIFGGRNYKRTIDAVNTNNPNFLEMEEYLLDNLEANGKYFVDNTYGYKNNFSQLLLTYVDAYVQSEIESTEEEKRNVNSLKSQIIEELSDYKNYRGLCKTRLKNRQITIVPRKNNIVTNLNVCEQMYAVKPYTFDKDKEITNQAIIYNEKYDEFLEPDEYKQMLGDSYK